MKKVKYGKWMCIIAAVCVLANGMTASAGTVSFDITSPTDSISPRVPKDSDEEQAYYVTAETFQGDDSMLCQSRQIENPEIKSYYKTVYKYRDNMRMTGNYQPNLYARAYLNYYLFGETYYTGARVTGWFTP